MRTLQHDAFCKVHGDYFTSDCEPFCDYYKEAVKECVDSGEHNKRIVSEGGYDVCFNCGTTA